IHSPRRSARSWYTAPVVPSVTSRSARRTVSSAISAQKRHLPVRYSAFTRSCKRLSNLRSRLAKTGAVDLQIGLGPDFFKLRFRLGRFLFVLLLRAQTFREPQQRPAVCRQTREIVPI